MYDHVNESELMTDALALETEEPIRDRLDSFYSATSKKSTYFSTGSVSSYHSFEDFNKSEDSNTEFCNIYSYSCGSAHSIFLLCKHLHANYSIKFAN